MLIVTASEEDQLKVAAVIDEADHRADGELTTKVYSLKWANPDAPTQLLDRADRSERHGQSRCLQQDV